MVTSAYRFVHPTLILDQESIRRTFENPHRDKIQHLDIPHFIQFPQCGLQCCEREKIRTSIPCEMVEDVEGFGYGQQDGVEDYGVEGYEEGAEVEGGYNEDEMGFRCGF